MERRKMRECIFKEVYFHDFYEGEDFEKQCENYLEDIEIVGDGDEEDAPLKPLKLAEKDKTEITEKSKKVIELIPQIDEKIDLVAQDWKTTRMNKVDLAILRLAVYEAIYDESIPVGVAINEAVELAKTFSNEKAASFINGILGKLVKTGEETKSDGKDDICGQPG